jgi:serine/threonine protein kinase/Tol biopolymer transport system component
VALTPGARLGIYEITSHIGEGGMGQVYRARDTKLDRDVAIKILPDVFAHDSDRLARFQREARTLASLNHPNIAIVHGLEQAGDVQALVMELVEGDDLSQVIARGPIPLDEALPIAKQIAEALEGAHEHGIIHRDLKPANIKVRSDGTVKVLDFGLAKATVPIGAASASVSMSPTITTPAMTHAGIVLGTAAYMSPEQARGRAVDKRSDVWAFGAVLFEMLTSGRAFPGEDVTDVIVSVISKEPDWTALPASTPVSVRLLLRRCLDKDPKRRLRDIGEARVALESSFETPAPLTKAATSVSTSRARQIWMPAFAIAAVLAAVLAIPTVRHLRETPPTAPPETRTDIITPVTSDPASFALSPDGRQIVFVASVDGAPRLWLRLLTSTTAQPLAGTEGAAAPFWSPDSRSVAFQGGNALKRIDLAGGPPRNLGPSTSGGGGTWNANGVIVFAANGASGLTRVADTGGISVAVTTLGPRQASHRFPHFLPDGRRFLFLVTGVSDTAGIYLGAIDASAPMRLTEANSSASYLPAGWLLWVRGGALAAQRLDVERKVLTGSPVTLAERVTVDSLGRSAISAAPTGLVAYRTGADNQRQLRWVDRSGISRGTVGDPDAAGLVDPRVSPDGRRVAVTRVVQGNSDLWIMDGTRTRRMTFDPSFERSPVWSPDGTRMVFHSARIGPGDLYQKLASGVEEPLVMSGQRKTATSWSSDGRFVLYHSADQTNNIDLWVVPMTGDRTPSVLLKTPFREGYGTFSPDGRWIAYQSDESGRPEIYVRPFVAPGDRVPVAAPTGSPSLVSTAGGIHPVWRPDGKELYYLDPTSTIMAAPIAVTGSTLEPGSPVRLFTARIVGGGLDSAQRRQYDVAPDGRFLINTVLDDAAPITLLQNWNPQGAK